MVSRSPVLVIILPAENVLCHASFRSNTYEKVQETVSTCSSVIQKSQPSTCSMPCTPGDTVRGVASLMQQQLDLFAEGGPTDRELSRVKKSARTSLLGAVQSNSAMASALCSYHALTGSWRGILDELAIVDDLSIGEVRDAAAAVFNSDNRFEGYMLPMPVKLQGTVAGL